MRDSIGVARAALARAREELMSHPNVVATGIGFRSTGGARVATPCIVCSVAETLEVRSLSQGERVPERLDGVPVDVVRTGPLHVLAARTDRHRPAPGGVSIGHPAITAGTLGCLVHKEGELVLLSNNHVLADNAATRLGDPILQPGPIDGGRDPADRIAELVGFEAISFRGARHEAIVENLVDAAIARPLDPCDVSEEILGVGEILDLASAELGMAIQKSGRTTGLTHGEILQIDVTADIDYGEGRVARFSDQLMAGPMSEGGDSGSVVLDAHARLVGLLFAGSRNTTLINRIEHVFLALEISP
jgi:hypothetical protein